MADDTPAGRAAAQTADKDFPAISGGGSLVVAWQLKGKPVLVIGGGEVATGRVRHLLVADADVTVLCAASGLSDELVHRAATGEIAHVDRHYDPDVDLVPVSPETVLSKPAMVMAAIDDPVLSTRVWQACQARSIPCNVADVPDECDFYFGSMYRDGPVQVMVSTNGNGPRMAALVRQRIQDSLEDLPLGRAAENLGRLRRRVRAAVPGTAASDVRTRMRWVSKVTSAWTVAQLAELDDAAIERLVDGMAGPLPSFESLKIGE
ncbi:putative NAD(P)-binding-domain-containing protein [Dipodascopsis tothii]|uniref:putative NAD(P)-binding-domain-containing protein n=1 Tax=Dipodascopsis tothii TaxID=44089 RepID=UPI0034CF7783